MMRQLPLQCRLESALAYRLEQTALPEKVPRVSLEILQQLVQKSLLFVCKFGHRLHLLMKLCVRLTTYTVFRTRPASLEHEIAHLQHSHPLWQYNAVEISFSTTKLQELAENDDLLQRQTSYKGNLVQMLLREHVSV